MIASHIAVQKIRDSRERYKQKVQALIAERDELLGCLKDIVREKELHGQVVDGTVAARKLIDKHQVLSQGVSE